MSTRRRPIRSEIWEGETLWTRALVVREDGVAAQPSDVTSWSVFLYDHGTIPGQVYSLEDQPASDAFYTTLQTSGWDGQAAGYNAEWQISPEDFPMKGGRAYEKTMEISTVSEGTLIITHLCDVKRVMST